MFDYKNPRARYVQEFIFRESQKYKQPNGFRFSIAASRITMKYGFACIVKDRSDPLQEEFARLCEEDRLSLAHIKTGPVPAERTQRLLQLDALTLELRMQFEIFFMYSSVICDQIAHLMPLMFGPVRRLKMDNHRTASKNLAAFIHEKGLEADQEMPALAAYLEAHLCDFRDKMIVHDYNARRVVSVAVGASEGMTLSSGWYFDQKPTDQPISSQGWNEVHDKLDAYIRAFLKLLADNREKTKFFATNVA